MQCTMKIVSAVAQQLQEQIPETFAEKMQQSTSSHGDKIAI